MRVRITVETIHGMPVERCILPVGALAVAVLADNLPPSDPPRYYVAPLCDGPANGWPENTAGWARDCGVLLTPAEFQPI